MGAARVTEGQVVEVRSIGYMYQHAFGVRQDLARATIWLRHASTLERRQLANGITPSCSLLLPAPGDAVG